MEVSSNKIIQTPLCCPGSKSYANRMLFLAALSEHETIVENIPQAHDVQYFLKALISLGFKISVDHNKVTFSSIEEFVPKETEVFLGEGGTTIRFMLILLASVGGKYSLKVNERFLKRPITGTIDLLSSLNVKVKIEGNIISLDGKLDSKSIVNIDCSKTTQFASAFKMLEKLGRVSKVEFLNIESSQKYLELTQSLEVKEKYTIPADFSSLSYIVAWGILEQDLVVSNVMEKDSFQADSILFDYLSQLDAKYKFTEQGLQVFKSELSGKLKVDASKSLDLIPTLVVIAAFNNLILEITNFENLIYKESNRLKAIEDTLKLFKVNYSLNNKLLTINGPLQSTENMDVECSFDHRVVMMNFLILKKIGGGSVLPIEAIDKSFPEFLSIFN